MSHPLMLAISEKNKKMYDSAIRHQIRLYGVNADIYYPKNVGHYSGRFDDIEYSDSPDLSVDLLIPSIYSSGFKTKGDVRDNLDSDEVKCYIPTEYDLPELTKLVCHSYSMGTYQYLVKDPLSFRTQVSDVYCEYIITPFVNYNRAVIEESDNVVLRDIYESDKAVRGYTDDKSISGPEREPSTDAYSSEINPIFTFNPARVKHD